MLQSAITIVFPLLYIFQEYYQAYQQSACMGAISVKETKSKTVRGNPLETERLGCTENCTYTMPSAINGDTKLFPPPISCLSLLNGGRRLNCYKLDMNAARLSVEDVILPDRGMIMCCLRQNGYLKPWFPLRPGVGGQPHQEGGDDEDDDSSDESSSSESDWWYTTSDEDWDVDDAIVNDAENPDDDGDEAIDINNDDDEHYGNGGDQEGNVNNDDDEHSGNGVDQEGNADHEEGNENGNNNNTS